MAIPLTTRIIGRSVVINKSIRNFWYGGGPNVSNYWNISCGEYWQARQTTGTVKNITDGDKVSVMFPLHGRYLMMYLAPEELDFAEDYYGTLKAHSESSESIPRGLYNTIRRRQRMSDASCKDRCTVIGRIFYKLFKRKDPVKVESGLNKIVKFAKNLTLSAEEKALRKVGLVTECGDYTAEAEKIVMQKLCADNKEYLVQIAKASEEEDKKK